jgi:hypothetical protein
VQDPDELVNVPGGHTQVVLPVVEYLPEGQSEQKLLPTMLENFPNEHWRQAVRSSLSLNVPILQSRHVFSDMYCPLLQKEQELAPIPEESPAGQDKHVWIEVAAEVFENVPCVHAVHEAAAALE